MDSQTSNTSATSVTPVQSAALDELNSSVQALTLHSSNGGCTSSTKECTGDGSITKSTSSSGCFSTKKSLHICKPIFTLLDSNL